MAQLGSAGALGALGRRFESCRPDSKNLLFAMGLAIMWLNSFFVGPFEPTKRQQMLRVLAIREASRALGLGRF